MSKTDKYINQAISNIQKDRDLTTTLLHDVMQYIGKDEHRHSEVGHVAAKYVESLQRSNEQLVKLTAILVKREDRDYGSLSDDDKVDIYDQINEDK
jgi:hypothetical protein